MAYFTNPRGLAVVLFAGLALALSGSDLPASPPTTLVDEDFQSDSTGAKARPLGPTSCAGEVYDDSDSPEGTSEVEADGSNKRYRLDDTSINGNYRGVKLPLSTDVSSGAITVTAVISAEQEEDGAVLAVSDPDNDEWLGRISFNGNGKFDVHGTGTSYEYDADKEYEVTIDISWGASNLTVDYAIEEVGNSSNSMTSTGHTTTGLPTAGSVRFRTHAAEEGGFTIDEVFVTQ